MKLPAVLRRRIQSVKSACAGTSCSQLVRQQIRLIDWRQSRIGISHRVRCYRILSQRTATTPRNKSAADY